MAESFSSSLYYPYIDIKNERWLRSAALFWDSIRTIVPDSIRVPYTTEFARELNDVGVLAPIRVASGMEEIESLTETVLDYLTDPSAIGLMLEANSNRDAPLEYSGLLDLRELSTISPQKLPYIIRNHLRHHLKEDGWYHVDPGFANFYMTLLATQLASRLGLGLVTESGNADKLAMAVKKGNPPALGRRVGRDYEAFGPRRTLPRDVARGLLIDLIVDGIELPRTLSVKDLLAFKQDHREELSVFRREIGRLTSDINTDMPVEALRQTVHDQYETEVRPAMKALRHSLKSRGWDTLLGGFLKLSFFTAAPTSAAVLSGVPASIALIAGAGISLTATVSTVFNQRTNAMMSSPYSYLLSLEREF